MEIVIANSQNRVKDCYASAPVINLTLRTNGEERTQVMDSLGQFVPAGIDAPTVAPTFQDGGTNPFVTKASMYVRYRYVYAATTRYPLVDNAVTAGGSIAPRGNPSPSGEKQISGGGASVVVTMDKSVRVDITAIHLYRTDFYVTQAEALAAADGGLMNWVATVASDGVAGTVNYTDVDLIISGNEQIELDNFFAPTAQLCVFADPHFYIIGNFPMEIEVEVAATGLITIVPVNQKWFDGRNGQLITMLGIDQGGFDDYGTFYFKQLTPTTGQLYFDLALTSAAGVTFTGTTFATIRGPATTLYRSKPHNPFSWGETILVGEISVPAVFVRTIGGGQATAMAVVAILNLLKIDTEGPNRTYVFTLTDIDATRREISSDFSASIHWSQFYTKSKDGNSYLWFFDSKYKAICQSDGATNLDVSLPVFESLRQISTISKERLLSHAIYDPSTQLSCFWFSKVGTDAFENEVNLLYHHPTNTWTRASMRDVLCSAPFLDRETNEQIVLVGTNTGHIGRAFTPNVLSFWINHPERWGVPFTYINSASLSSAATDFTADENLVGVWVELFGVYAPGSGPVYALPYSADGYVGAARISSAIFAAATTTLIFDLFVDTNGNPVGNLDLLFPAAATVDGFFHLWAGGIVCRANKFLSLETIARKKLQEIWMTVEAEILDDTDPIISSVRGRISNEFSSEFGYEFVFTPDKQISNLAANVGAEVFSNAIYVKNPYTVDLSRGFQFAAFELSYSPFIWHDYQFNFDNF